MHWVNKPCSGLLPHHPCPSSRVAPSLLSTCGGREGRGGGEGVLSSWGCVNECLCPLVVGELKGVMRVGAFARGLLLRGECTVELVLMCTGKYLL